MTHENRHARPISELLVAAGMIAAWPVVLVVFVVLVVRHGWRGLCVAALISTCAGATAHPAPRVHATLAEELPGEWYLDWGGGHYRAAFTADGSYHWCGCAKPFHPVEYTLIHGGWRVLSESRGVYQIAVREGEGWYRWELRRTADGWGGKFWRARDAAGEPIDNAWRAVRLQPLRRHPEWIKFAAGRLD